MGKLLIQIYILLVVVVVVVVVLHVLLDAGHVLILHRIVQSV